MKIYDQIDDIFYGGTQINVAELMYDEISIHTILVGRNIGAIDLQMLTMVVNAMLVDKFLKWYIF